MIFAAVLLFGLVVGSFLNVVIHRVPLRQSIVWPSSHCPECGKEISPRDNIPLLSYVLLRGRCRNCKAHILARYPLVEALTAVLFGLAAYAFGLSLELLSALVLIGALIVLTATDLEHRLLPNAIIFPAALVGFVISVAVEPSRWWFYLVSALAVGGALFVLALAYSGGMGMGDVKMAAMLGLFLGPYAALAVFIGALVGVVTGGLLLLIGRTTRRTALPFGAFLALGGLAALFLGPGIWGAYLRLAGVG